MIDYAYYVRPCIGERHSGDAVVISRRDNILFVAIIDVLGHGDEAYVVAKQIKSFLLENWNSNVCETMTALHNAIKGSRGAAGGLSVIDTESGELTFTGVGNTVSRKIGDRSHRLFSIEGIIGQHIRKPVEQKMTIQKSDILLYYTDGISDRFELPDYPQMRYEQVANISRHVVSQFGKTYDDATCIALRYTDD